MPFRIAQLSDTHLSGAKPFFVENFRRIAAALVADGPDLAINSGDISLNGADDEADLAAARHLHEVLRAPVRFIPGNHDVGDNPDVPGAHGGAIDAARRQRYVDHFGDDWWRLDVPGWRIIGLNAQLVGSDLDAANEQERFVAECVADAAGRQIAVFIHKPLCDRSVAEDAVGGRFLNPAPRRRLLNAMGSVRAALVACGHVHQYRSTIVDGARHVWAPSTAYFIPDTRQPRYGLKEVGYVMHELYEDGTHASHYATAAGVENLCIADFPDAYGPMN